MKKFMIAMVAVALATVANAALTYDCTVIGAISPNKADTNPGSSYASYYSFYAMKQVDARALVGSQTEVDYLDVAKWLGSQVVWGSFDKTVEKVADHSQKVGSDGFGSGTYQFYTMGSGYQPEKDSIGVFFYNNGTAKEYVVLSVAKDVTTSMYFSASDGSQSSGWAAPEPTSGLLLLLGVAGLALKRKQK